MNEPLNPRCNYLIEIAQEVIHHVTDPDLRAAFLFGSAAWGDADEASDIDIMLLLDRPAGYREVTRVRLPDLLGRPLPDGPLFADLDRFSVETFTDVMSKGGWAHRVIHSIILKDTEGYYERIRAHASAEFFAPAARTARFRKRQEQVAAQRLVMRQALDGDDALAALHARLALEAAATALIDLNDDRVSLTHFVESVERALIHIGQGRHFTSFLQMLALDAPLASAERSLRAYRMFADALRTWVADPHVGGRLSREDLAWAEFTYGEQTYEEIYHKVATFKNHGRTPALLYYLDGLLQVPIRLNIGKIFLLRSTGAAGRMSLPDFQVALRAEPALMEAWVSALRLVSPHNHARSADELAAELLRVGESALQAVAPTTQMR
jgi:predicted nucleotidyltransferase